MFDYFVSVYNNLSQNEDTLWPNAAFLDKNDLWATICSKLDTLNKDTYYFALHRYTSIEELIEAIRTYVDTDKFYNELYGKTYSEARHQDLINIAKLIALHQGTINYHRYLLGDAIQDDNIVFDRKTYQLPHAELCAVKNRNPAANPFDLLTFDDLLGHLKQAGRLESFYSKEIIIPAETIAHWDCAHREEYLRYCDSISGNLSKPAYYAIKDFVELVSNEYDANHNIDGFLYQRRVDAKYKALQTLCAYLESLPVQERNELQAMKIRNGQTLLTRLNEVKGGGCVSQFADDLTKVLYQCNNDVRFTNPRPSQVIERQRDALVLKGQVLDTEAGDKEFLRNLQTVIINTSFKVRIGTKVSLPDGTGNRVPSHVAEIFNLCKKALADNMDSGEARYQAIKIAAECFRTPHSSRFFFLNTRDITTQNFYKLLIDSNSVAILRENDRLDNHPAFRVG